MNGKSERRKSRKIHLNRFPAEVLAIITSYVSGFDVCHLFWTGDSKLCRVLQQGGVEVFRLEVTGHMPTNGLNRWPSLVERLSGLLSLTISIDVPYTEDNAPLSHIRPDLLPPTLQEIHFQFLQAESCFVRYPAPFNVVFPHQLPSSQSVELGDYSDSEEWIESDQEDPLFPGDDGEPTRLSDLTDLVNQRLDNLPKPVEVSLYDQDRYRSESWDEDGRFNFRKLFPHLRTLSLIGVSSLDPRTLSLLPDSLTCISLKSGSKFEDIESLQNVSCFGFLNFSSDWNANLRPKSIPFLETIQVDKLTFEATCSTHLTTVVLREPNWQWDLSLLPRSLTSLTIDRPKTSSHVTSQDVLWPSMLSHLKLVRCRWPQHWPPALTSLEALEFHELTKVSQLSALPRGLLHLDLYHAIVSWTPAEIRHLPPSLTCLRASRSDTDSLAIKHLTELPCAKNLKELKLGATTDPELIKHLPRSLTTLTLSCGQSVRKAFHHLPEGLQSLSISMKGQDIEGKVIKLLPRGLKYLHVSCRYIDCDFFEYLPSELMSLTVWSCHRTGKTNPLIPSRLPKFLTQLLIPQSFFAPYETILQIPRGVVNLSLLFPFTLEGKRCHYLPPSLALPAKNVGCSPQYDLPPSPSDEPSDPSNPKKKKKQKRSKE